MALQDFISLALVGLSDCQAEVVLFALAALVYQIFAGRRVVAGRAKKIPKKSNPRLRSSCTKTASSSKPPVFRSRAQTEAGSHFGAEASEHQNLLAECRAALHAGQLHAVLNALRKMDGAGEHGAHGAVLGAPTSMWKQFLELAAHHQDLNCVRIAMHRLRARAQLDKVTYNHAIKAFLLQKHHEEACTFFTDMIDAGLTPGVTTFNAVLTHLIDTGVAKHHTKAWSICDDMMRVGVPPNHVTGSLVLKMVGAKSSQADIQRAMDFVHNITESADEGLTSSVLEAYIRTGEVSLVAKALDRVHNDETFEPALSSTFGTLIKAHSFVGDMQGVRQSWLQLRATRCPVSSVTIGCMVEALVAGGDTDGAHELVSELRADSDCQHQLNAVVYGSILKGYGRTHRMKKVWTVFKEMLDSNIQPEKSTINTMIDACTRNSEMSKVPELLEVMRKFGMSPDVITYSTVIKGHCQGGNMHLAFAVFEELKQTPGIRCDQILYNTLIDGCVAGGLVVECERVMQEMANGGYQMTASVLVRVVRLYGRSRRVGEAFEVVAGVSKSTNKDPPASVLAALVSISLTAKDIPRAMEAFKQMRGQGFQLDPRTQQALILAAISHGMLDVVEGPLRDTLGLGTPRRRIAYDDTAVGCATFSTCVLRLLRAEGHREFANHLEADLRALRRAG